MASCPPKFSSPVSERSCFRDHHERSGVIPEAKSAASKWQWKQKSSHAKRKKSADKLAFHNINFVLQRRLPGFRAAERKAGAYIEGGGGATSWVRHKLQQWMQLSQPTTQSSSTL